MKVIQQFSSVEQAHLALAMLEQAGIEAYLWDEQISGLLPLFNPNLGMVRLAVGDEDEAPAKVLLETCGALLP